MRVFRDYGLDHKIESWNFQHLLGKEFRETSQSFNSFSWFRQFLFPFFPSVVWLSWNFVMFHEFFFQTHAKNFSFLSWKNKKVLFQKKFELSQEWTGFNIKTTSFVYWPNFQQRFCYILTVYLYIKLFVI